MIDQTMLHNPYVGLKPFDTSDSLFFFGRKQQTAELLQKLHQTRFLAVVGTSGCGKSSLIRAGLIPHLKAGFLLEDRNQWQQVVMKPGSRPLQAFVKAIYDAFSNDTDNKTSDQIQEQAKKLKTVGIRGIIKWIESFQLNKNTNILLLVDQFEEIFECLEQNKTTEEKEEAQRFVAIMLGLAEQRLFPVYTVLTMRSDFLGDCDRFFGLPETMNQSQYLVPRMTRDQRMEAIKGPAALLGGKITDRLMQRLLNDSSENSDHLPILQHAMMRTWDRCFQIDDQEPDIVHYEHMGGMDQALSRHANEIFNSLNDHQKNIAEKIFKAITNKGTDDRGIRRPTKLCDLYKIVKAEKHDIKAVINAFRQPGCTFIFPHNDQEELQDNDEINITHESLMRVWDKLKIWVNQEAESARRYLRLVESAELKQDDLSGFLSDIELSVLKEWKENHQPDRAWAERYHKNFDQAMNYLDASQEDANKRQKEAEKLEKQRQEFDKAEQRAAFQRKITATISVFLCLALFLAGFSGYQYYNAEQARIQAEQAREQAVLARNQEKQARAQAEESLTIAKQQRKIADTQRKKADQERQIAQKRLTEILQLQDTLNPLAEKQGRLYVNVTPKDAKIIIEELNQIYSNGMKIDKGRYTVLISKKDYYSKKLSVNIKSGQENKLPHVKLQPMPGQIHITGQPPNAKIFVNAVHKGTGDLLLKDIKPNTYTIRAEKKGYEPYEEKIVIKPNQKAKMEYKLVQYAKLTIMPNIKEALIRIMNIKPVYTPGISLLPGKYHINVSKKKYIEFNEWIELAEGESKQLTVTLTPVSKNKLTNSIGMTFVLIPAGTFQMGSPKSEANRGSDETLHQVTISKNFYMQTTEVTQGQWMAVMGNNPSYFKNCGKDCPVEQVSWNDVQKFIQRLNKLEKAQVYRLPTEAQWEYAARAGTSTPFAFGNCLNTEDANYDGNYPYKGCSKGQYRKRTIQVGSLRRNKWGLYDMHGNVWEWCQDWYDKNYLTGLVIDPVGPSSGSNRVVRGGSWFSGARYCRSAFRSYWLPGNRDSYVGFRLLRIKP